MGERVDPKLQAEIVKDPVAAFRVFAAMYEAGSSPIKEGLLPPNPVTKKVKSPDRWAKQMIENASKAGDDWLDGVKNPSRNPIEAAIAAEDKWKDRLEAAIKSGKWKKNLGKVTHAELVEVAEAVGASGYQNGVAARENKIKKRVAELHPLVQAVSDTIQGMPNKTDADREKRLLAARKLMIEVGNKRAGA